MTIRNVPSFHSASDLYPSQLQRSLQASNPCPLPVVKISGTTLPMVTLAVLVAAADQIGLLGRDSLAAFLPSIQSKTKATTYDSQLAQKETEHNKASRRVRLKPLRSCGNNSKMNRINSGGLFQPWHRPRKLRNNLWMVYLLCALLCMVLVPMVTRMHHDLHQRKRTPTCSNRRSSYSMNLQRGQDTESNVDH